jgi:1,4-alpha-glucan branching enzyme
MNRRQECVVAYKRKGNKPADDILVVLNMTANVRHDFPIYVNGKSKWKEIFNSDNKEYWGTGDAFNPKIPSKLVDKKEKRYELKLHLPALGAIILK